MLLRTVIFGHEKHLYFSQDMQVKQDLGVFGLLHRGLLGDVEAVKELPDILVLYRGRLLDEGGRLGHSLDGVALQRQQFVTQLEHKEGEKFYIVILTIETTKRPSIYYVIPDKSDIS